MRVLAKFALAFVPLISFSHLSAAFPTFETVDIDRDAGTGLAIAVADINGDGLEDIVGVSADDVAWYENPTWERHLMAPALRNSNVCVAVQDLDGDGIPELVIGADWQYNNTDDGGALYLLAHEEDVKSLWKVRTLLDTCPTLHRIRWMTIAGAPALAVAPLKGVGSRGPGFQETGVDLFALIPPIAFFTGEWTRLPINDSLHVLHNIWPVPGKGGTDDLLAASFEGITWITYNGTAWKSEALAPGNPEPLPDGGAGEIKPGTWGDKTFLATIEPWHGHQAVVYHPEEGALTRVVVDDTFKGGHVVYWADFDGDGDDELLAGYRDKAGPEGQPGLYVYDFAMDSGGVLKATKFTVDAGGMATEDGAVGDMNGDGLPDVVAYGRATHNVRLYLNQGE